MSLMVGGWWRNVCGYLDPRPWSKSQTTSFHLEGFPLHVQCHFPPVFPLCLLGKVLEFSEIYHNLCCFSMCALETQVWVYSTWTVLSPAFAISLWPCSVWNVPCLPTTGLPPAPCSYVLNQSIMLLDVFLLVSPTTL